MIQTVNDTFCQHIFQKRAPTQNKSNFNLSSCGVAKFSTLIKTRTKGLRSTIASLQIGNITTYQF